MVVFLEEGVNGMNVSITHRQLSPKKADGIFF